MLTFSPAAQPAVTQSDRKLASEQILRQLLTSLNASSTSRPEFDVVSLLPSLLYSLGFGAACLLFAAFVAHPVAGRVLFVPQQRQHQPRIFYNEILVTTSICCQLQPSRPRQSHIIHTALSVSIHRYNHWLQSAARLRERPRQCIAIH